MPDMRQWPMHLAAIIMYTFDLSLITTTAKNEDNFYFLLNQVSYQHVLC
jgi:hypothetical protein